MPGVSARAQDPTDALTRQTVGKWPLGGRRAVAPLSACRLANQAAFPRIVLPSRAG
jgi:hypothetical protein